MAQGYSIFIGAVIVAAMCVGAWFLSPKGENQVYVVLPLTLPRNPTSAIPPSGAFGHLSIQTMESDQKRSADRKADSIRNKKHRNLKGGKYVSKDKQKADA
ncbi:hypothetical protein NPX13_g10681 [Xylaria arbuscula]|uniref:Uncharacterized protein n=1 Tax=Xylaria arbuscula TaxID=114810 RepID=A0A9W8THR5_9PEZI|nr:hypothetical protein NPX13_g10681 [Xylaria arbuscula]